MDTVAIVVGHNKGTGARSLDGVDEWQWNYEKAFHMRRGLEALGVKVHILYRNGRVGYTAAMKELGRQMKALGVTLCVELHFNWSAPSAQGQEYLYWWGSRKSKRLAQCIADANRVGCPEIVMRGSNGIRPIWYFRKNEWRGYSNRGGGFLYHTPCPAVIIEPGFASNEHDWSILRNGQADSAARDVAGIWKYLQWN